MRTIKIITYPLLLTASICLLSGGCKKEVVSNAVSSADSVTVIKNATPGGLYNSLTSSQMANSTSLTISGTIDARDFELMNEDMPKLKIIDISNATIIAYSGTLGSYGSSSMVIYSANTIPEAAFEGKSLMSLILPKTIIKIDRYAFENCKIAGTVIIPNTVDTIGSNAFYGCQIKGSINIPASVLSIGSNAFESFNDSIVVDGANPKYSSSEGVFFNKAQDTLIQCPTSKTGTYSIPSTVTYIGYNAFYNSKISTLVIPSGFSNISYSSFYNFNGILSVDPSNQYYSSVDGVLFNKTQDILIQCPKSKTGIYNVPSTVVTISSNAFQNCSNITSIVIPTSVTSIGSDAFYYCSSLSSITIPTSVTSIGSSAFSNCSILNNITIPTSVSSISSSAFYYCSSLTNISIPNSVSTINPDAFYRCSALSSITIPSSVTSIGSYAFGYCSALSSISIPNSVTSIGSYAFNACSSLQTVTVNTGTPINLTSVSNVFAGIPSNSTLYVPKGSKAAYQAATGWSAFTNIVEQ